MKEESPDPRDESMSPVNQEASEWVVKQAYGLTAEEQDAFFDWLALDPLHAEAYADRKKLWKGLDILADWRPEHSLKPNPNLLETATPKNKKRYRKTFSFIAATAAVVAVGLWYLNGVDRFNSPEATEIVQSYERRVLVDGSVIELNEGARVDVEYTNDYRRIHLEAGEAYFTVAKDRLRPFVVMANGIAVQAVGTVFNVDFDRGLVDVIVTEGKVMVGQTFDDDLILKEEYLGERVKALVAGQRTVVDFSSDIVVSEVETISQNQIDESLLWLDRMMEFSNTSLSDVVMELNRRNGRKMVIEDSAIENLKLSVSISPKNVDGFIEVITATMNIEAESIGDSVIVLRSKY